MRPALLALISAWVQLLLTREAASELTNVHATGTYNLAAELQHAIQDSSYNLLHACSMEPAEFLPEERFYVFSCLHTAMSVDLVLTGKDLFMGGKGGGYPLVDKRIHVDLPKYEDPHIIKVISCANNTAVPDKTCEKYTFDVYRQGGDLASLAMLGVAPAGAQPMHLDPPFNPHVMEYSTRATLDQPFSIIASSSEYKSSVGIEYEGASAALSGLGDQNGCGLGLRKHMRWDLPGFESTGTHVYIVCAIAPDRLHMLKYRLNVTVVPPYSEELQSIVVGSPYGLTTEFSPSVNVYEVKIPAHKDFKASKRVEITVKANDTQAKISFSIDGKAAGNDAHGSNNVTVHTRDNQHLKFGQTPEWTKALTIKVTSADNRKSRSYMVKVRQEVSTYCKLKDIELPGMNCSLLRWGEEVKPGDEKPVGFIPNHTQYECIWDYSTGKRAHVVVHKDVGKCVDCEIRIPDPEQADGSKLYLSYWLRDRIEWEELPVDKHRHREWTREFLYGAYYTLPIQVISADKFTSCWYELYLERWSPWYMRVATTRFVSKTSMTLSTLMAFTGAANVMALAKQVQFMSLTTEIDDVPQVYKDYAETLEAFNLEIPMPDIGLPTEDDFKKYKERMLEQLKEVTGIQHARLLVQYSYARREISRLAANAILHAHPSDTKVLLSHDTSDFSCKTFKKGICKQIAEEKKAKAEKASERRLGRVRWLRNVSGLANATTMANSDLGVAALSDGEVGALRRLDGDEEKEEEDKKEEEEEEEEEEANEDDYPDVWFWSEDEWDEFIEKAKNDSVTEDSYQEIPINTPLLEHAVTATIFAHKLHLLRKMLHSTVGSFILILLGIISVGSIYFIYWTFFMKHNQRRAKILEPGQFWLFVMDYALIGFSKKAADLFFKESLVTFVVFKPHRWMTQSFCGLAILLYPIAFTLFVLISMMKVTSALCFSHSRARLVFNTKREQWLDPECNDLKVTIEPKIPRSIPLIPQLITQHVRACVPVLNQDGEKLEFDEDERQWGEDGTFERKGAIIKRKRVEKKKGMMEDKVEHARELKRMDDLIQEELKQLSSQHNAQKMQSRLTRLKKESDMAVKETEWKKRHAEGIEDRNKRLQALLTKEASATEPPWFAIVGNKEHIKTKKGSDKPSTPDEGDKREKDWSIVNMAELSAGWKPKKGRADNETLDSEEKFAIMQYIQAHMRTEKKFHKYNILSVILEHGYMKPKEPLKLEHRLTGAEKTINLPSGVEFVVKKVGTQHKVDKIGDDEWARANNIKPGDDILKIGTTPTEGIAETDTETLLKKRPVQLVVWHGDERNWLPEKQDYLNEELENGHHPMLEEFMPGSAYIENDLGERLVYGGDTSATLGWVKTGWGEKAGPVSWQSEPDVGWALWEEEIKGTTTKYADKWQWIIFDYPNLPWTHDEGGEELCCAGTRCQFKRTSLPLHDEIRDNIYSFYKDRVPSVVTAREKIEIRKWLWSKLKPAMELKLQLSVLADSHPKYFRERTLQEVAAKDFHQVMFEIETAKPSEDWIAEFKGDKDNSPQANPKRQPTRSQSTVSGSRLTARLKRSGAAAQMNPHELAEFTMMKFEDQFPFDQEPWWQEADERAQERGQVKVMFDHDLFWKAAGDPRLQHVRRDNNLVPENGYNSSAMFLEHSQEVMGQKHYQFLKPDNTMTPVSCNLTMGHVPPLMRYTNRFKANVPIDSLDLPQRSAWQIVINEKKRGEEFNYVVDRGTTLISILCISANCGGFRTALVFFSMKIITLLNQVWTSFKSQRAKNDEEQQDTPQETKGETEPLLAGSTSSVVVSTPKYGRRAKPLWRELSEACQQVDVGVLCLQAVTLLLLAAGQPSLPDPIPENLCAFFCIILCSFTMIFMNVFTFSSELKKMFNDWMDWVKGLGQGWRNGVHRAKEFLGGDNPLGIQFITIDTASTTQIIKASKIAVVIPDLGIHFSGDPDIKDNTPPDEKRQMELLKKVSYWVLQRESNEDTRPKSVRDIPRFEKDIENTLSVALTVDQMMMYAKIPQIQATIQCVNHTNSGLSRPQYDNYLTLYKPDDWEPEFDQDPAKVEKMLMGWREQAYAWFKESLGAVESERTCTTQIEDQLSNILRKECTGALTRDILMIELGSIHLPAKGSRKVANLLGMVGYASIIYENEKVTADFPTNRMTNYSKFVAYNRENDTGPQVAMDHVQSMVSKAARENLHATEKERHDALAVSIAFHEGLVMEIPVGVTRVRVALWVQLSGKNMDGTDKHTEELVAYSSEIDVVEMSINELVEGDTLEFFMHNSWKHISGHKLAPLGGEEEDAEMKKRREQEAEEEAEMSRMARCWKKFKAGLSFCIRCKCCSPPPSEETIKHSRGILQLKARRPDEGEAEHDRLVLLALKNVVQGESSLSHSKLERHRDRYVELAEFFGVYLREGDMQVLKDHLSRMKAVNEELWPAAERRKTQEQKAKNLVKRQKRVLDEGIRRHLESYEEMDLAIETFQRQIAIQEERLKTQKDRGVDPVPPYLVRKRYISDREVYHGNRDRLKEADQGGTEAADRLISSVLLDELVKYRLEQTQSAKSIVHYVVLSDHLKPGKNWRPDTIVPHVANLVTHDFEDVPDVKMTGGQKRDGMGDVIFRRQIKEGSTDEAAVLHGRLVYKADSPDQVFPGCSEDVWLYWDGMCRWVISPFYAMPPPYGLDHHEGENPNLFMWNKDMAVTPDKIQQSWMIWAKARRSQRDTMVKAESERRTTVSGGEKKWEKDLTLRLLGKEQGRKGRNYEDYATTLDDNQTTERTGIAGMVQDGVSEVLKLFTLSGHQKSDPCLKECLVSLDSRYLTFAWKDFSIERLAPFRKFLLNEFGTYQSAWVYITRKAWLPKQLGVKNLAGMLKHCLEQIEREDSEDKEAAEMSALEHMDDTSPTTEGAASPAASQTGRSWLSMRLTRKSKDQQRASAAGSPPKLPESKSKVEFASEGEENRTPRSMMSPRSMTRGLSRGMTKSQPMTEDGTMTNGVGSTFRSEPSRFTAESKKIMKAFLTKKRAWDTEKKKKPKGRLNIMRARHGHDHHHEHHDGQDGEDHEEEHDFQIMADKLLDIIDRNPKNGMIDVEEVHAIYEVEPQEELLKEFRAFILAHPMYRDIEYFWEPLSEGFEITLEQFTEATERIMLKFRAVRRPGEGQVGNTTPRASEMGKRSNTLTPTEKAQQVFADLDSTNMSGGISFSELRPFSGDRFEDADKSMLKFPIPLTHVKEIVCQGQIKKFSADKRCLRFHLNHQFENAKPWRDLRTALDPDWEPVPNNEYIQVVMSQQFYDLWRQVIKVSEMVSPQEWIRYYDGEYKEHPIVSGTYMRHGEGTQKWSEGKVYVGQWQNHVYHGQGRLWASMVDYELNKAPPIYVGEWQRGKQHGHGVLRYEQDIQDRRGKAALSRGQHAGISKVYTGSFRNGLFHGRGTLKMEKAVAQHLPGRSREGSEVRPGFMPLPILDPASIISFEGFFKSDWAKTNKQTREVDPVFNSRDPPIKHNKNKGALRLRKDEEKEEEIERMDLDLENLTKQHKSTDRFTRFFSVDERRVQRAGGAMPDLGLATYQLKGGDALHMRWASSCRFADGTEYEGRFENGKPHTKDLEGEPGADEESTDDEGGGSHKRDPTVAVTSQYEVLPTGEKGKFLARYTGSFKDGERHGSGKYETWDGLVYEGQWEKNRRHGQGKQTLAEKCQEDMGYVCYEGEWMEDMKHGTGKMYFGEGGLLMYEGPFQNDQREGVGAIYLLSSSDRKGKTSKKSGSMLEQDPNKIVVYNGNFLHDLPHSTDDAPIWSHLVVPGETRGRFFYGRLDHEGKRAGIGTVYDEDAEDDPAFVECFKNSRAYTKEDTNDPSTWRYITYHGPFRNDLPHGEGTQHFFNKHDKKRSGIYKGQFMDGQRHGRGVWRTLDDSWKYRPIEQNHVANWDHDLMHGIGIVEDREHVHENVIYTHGRCQMPFTDMGPPLTGFDNTVVIGNVMKVARTARKAAGGNLGHHGPQASIATTKKSYGGIFGNGREDHAQGVNQAETKAMQLMSQSLVMAKRNQNNSNTETGSSALSRTEEEDEMEALAMVREETDLTMPEEDVMIKGGTGENEVLNGLYFKLSGTYGLAIYKMAKKIGLKSPQVRYLFKDVKTKCWVIAPRPLCGIVMAPGCAFVEDEEADRPGTVGNAWYVWYPPKKAMKCPADEEEGSDILKKMDKITAVSIVGFEILGMEGTKIRPGLLLRHGRELFGRPVYEAESGGQFLYWMKTKGKLAEGMLEDDSELTGGKADHSKLFASAGHWIISAEVGETQGSPLCLAYVEDMAITPDQISSRSVWYVATNNPRSSRREDGYHFERNTTIKLHAEEWSRNTSTLANFDEEDPSPGGHEGR